MSKKPTGRKRLRVVRIFTGVSLFVALAVGGWLFLRYHGPAPEREIYRGIFYGCERLPDTDQSGGLYHWVRADLNVAGVSIYATPKDPDAAAMGSEYKLKYTSTAVSENDLAAAVNGTLFKSDSWYVRLPGDLATSSETIVADHVVNHIDPISYLMWWGDDSIAHLERWAPPPMESVRAARWAIAGQQPLLRPFDRAQNSDADHRTVIAADPDKKLVWIACFDKASYRFIVDFMEPRGAKYIISVDGGTSTAMAIGSRARNVRPGTVTGNWRPVATHFGFRALPLP